jgi:hypothetical protein
MRSTDQTVCPFSAIQYRSVRQVHFMKQQPLARGLQKIRAPIAIDVENYPTKSDSG